MDVDKSLQILLSDAFWFEREKSSLKGGMIILVTYMLNKPRLQTQKRKA
jgi:hypothetical protein|tara:strand:- start:125 stop:271 length:147 start_codon:yes stop_codon:yes gene_type:complete